MAKRTTEQMAEQVEAKLRLETARLELDQVKLRRGIAKTRTEMLSTYGAAAKTRTTRDWNAPTVSADQAILNDSSTLNARARKARRDHWAGAAIAGHYRRNLVGIGITPRSAARDPRTGEPFTEFNETIDTLWDSWARRKQWCDIEQRKTFVECQGLAAEELAVVGESFTILVYEPEQDRVGVRLQMIEPEQIDTTISRSPVTGNDVHGGVEVDKFGAPVAYFIFTTAHPLVKFSIKSSRIEADRVLHLYRPDRVRQTRGVSKFTVILAKLWHLQMYDEYQLLAARLEACIGGVIKRESLTGDSNIGLPPETATGETAYDERGSDKIIFEPAMMPKLLPGEDIVFNTPQKPGGSYDPFVKAQIGQIGAGVGLDYAAVARDYSQGNFSSQRQGLLECNKETDSLQLLIVTDWCEPIREEFKRRAILERRVAAPGFLADPLLTAAYLEDEWQAPPKPWIDPVKQAAAAKIALDYKLLTRRELNNELGKNWAAGFLQTHDEEALASELGIYLPDAQAKASGGGPPVAPQEPRPGREQPEEGMSGGNGREVLAMIAELLSDSIAARQSQSPSGR